MARNKSTRKKPKLHVSSQLMIFTEESPRHGAFRHGVFKILQAMLKHNSLKDAAASIGMSYSKAWRMLNETEETLGRKLYQNNSMRGSTLTPPARKMLAMYRDVSAECEELVKSRCQSFLEHIDD